MAERQRYPECEKLGSVAQQSQIIEEFLEWLSETKGLVLWDDAEISGRGYTTESLLAEFFDIDMEKVEAERQRLRANIRGNNG